MHKPRQVYPTLVLAAAALQTTNAAAAIPDYDGVVTQGDFDGDGVLETVVSSPEDDCGRGVIHIRDGSSVSSWTRDTYGVLGSASCDDHFGTAMVSGDFDNDGYDDLAVSAPGASDSGETHSGSVHVFYGGTAGLTTAGDQLWHQDITGIQGTGEIDDFAGDVLEVGDFNCDGYDDLVIGVPREDLSGAQDAGATHVLYGSKGGTSSVNDWWHQNIRGVEDTVEPGDNFGAALAAGNFNGDKLGAFACDDLAIASPGESVGSHSRAGSLYVINGDSSGLSILGDQWVHQDILGVAGVAEHHDQFGARLLVFDDNGDRFDDLAVSVPGDSCSSGVGEGLQIMRGGSGGIRATDDRMECDSYSCWIDEESYHCPSHAPPVFGTTDGEDFALLVTDDRVWGRGGSDTITSDSGNDVVFGGEGDDLLRGGVGADVLIGGLGDDSFEVGLDCEAVAGDIIDGGPGNDTVLSHLSRAEFIARGVTFRSVENFVSQPADEDGDCSDSPNKNHPSDIVAIELDKTFYEKEDEVIIDISLRRADLTVWADFAAVDTAYSRGDEQVIGSGTQDVQLRYKFSGNSIVEAGNVRVPIEVRDQAGRLLHRFGVALKYAPSGVPSLIPVSGGFRLSARPTRPDSGWRVQSARFVTNTPSVPPPPQFDFSTSSAALPTPDRTLEVTFRAPQGATIGNMLQLEVGEKGRDGTFAVLGDVQPSCTPVPGTADCEYVVNVGFDAATGDATLAPLDIRILDSAGGVSPQTEFPLQAEGIDPAWARVRGRVRVRYHRMEADISDPGLFQSGSIFLEETFPLPEGTHIRMNFCGQVGTGTVDINGEFNLGFYTNCVGETDGYVEVFSSTGGFATNRIAVGSWASSPITDASDLTNDPDDYSVYVVRVGDGLHVDDAASPGGINIGTYTIEQDSFPGATAAFVGMRAVVDAIKYVDGFDGVQLSDLPSVNILADEGICLTTTNDDGEVTSCNKFGGQTLTGIHPGFFYIQNFNITREWTYAHEWGHVYHERMLRNERYGEFGEGYANVLSQAALAFAGRADAGWVYPLGAIASENMDFNGKSNPTSQGLTDQVVMRPFFGSTTEAAAVAAEFGCDEPDGEGNPPSTQQKGNCVMSQSQGASWRLYWDLHDGGGSSEPVWNFVDEEGNVTNSQPSFDQIDGGGSVPAPEGHVFHQVLLGYVASDAAGGSHPNYVDRGQTKLDIVDVLDGMVCKGAMTQEEGNDLLSDVHGFEYDFTPVNLTCN